MSTQALRLAVIGGGSFARSFLPLFRVHPGVAEVGLAEVDPARLAEVAAAHGIVRTWPTAEAAIADPAVDAVAIFTQRHLHGPQALAALRAGKHVYSAVPCGASLEEIAAIVEEVKRTGLTYALGETSYYYPTTVYCRYRYRRGDFGRFVYGEGEYMHDMAHGFYQAYQHSGGADWRRVAGFPPMFYPTHTVAMLTAVTGARLTHVSCLGFRDSELDGVFGREANLWANEFSNQSALARTSDGGMFRFNEFRRVGHGVGTSVRVGVFGTLGAFEEQPTAMTFTDHDLRVVDLRRLLDCKASWSGVRPEERAGGTQMDFFSGSARVHPNERLPEAFRTERNGHHGSHQLLVDDFVRAVATGKLPPNHVWAAAAYNAPGLVAHESSLREGERLEVPDFGGPPEGARLLEAELPIVSAAAAAEIEADRGEPGGVKWWEPKPAGR